MGGHQVPEQGPNDDGYDEEGYDESQRAEILEVTRDGPSDGTVLTDIAPDLGDEDDDDLPLDADEIGEEAEDSELDEDDQDEDDLQEDFEDDDLADDDDLDDADRKALEP